MKNNFLEVPKFINSDLEYKRITNKFEIIKDNFPDKYIINLFYIEKNLCLFKLRRIDSEFGWDKDLKIIIYSERKNENEIISIGKSYKNAKIIEVYTNVELISNNKDTISRNIIQTRDNDFKNYIECENFYNFISKNLEHNYYNFNKNGRRDFIIDNYKDKINIYDTISDNNLKKKVFILCYVNFVGGIYIEDNLNLEEISNLNLNQNLINIENNNFSMLNCTENSINIKKLFNDIESKKKLIFRNYLENLTEIELNVKCNDKINFLYYDNVFHFKNYKILILNSNSNHDFIIEEMDEGYYLVKEQNNKIFNDINIKYINLINNNEGYLNKNNYKLSKNNLKIFKID